MSSARTTQEVLDDHLRLRQRGDLDTDLARNYAESIVLLTSQGVFRGHDGVRASTSLLRQSVPDARYEYRHCLVEGELAFMEWGATGDGARIEDGVDSYLIRDGRFLMMTIHYTVIPDA